MSRKLFVIVRADLSWSHRVVQTAHAVGRFCSSELIRVEQVCGRFESLPPRWDDETLVVLKARDLEELEKLHAECEEAWPFYEPDIGDEMTAFAVLTPPELFGNLKLL